MCAHTRPTYPRRTYHYLATIPLTRSQNDLGLEIGSNTKLNFLGLVGYYYAGSSAMSPANAFLCNLTSFKSGSP